MALQQVSPGHYLDEDPFEGLCDVCGEPIFRAGGWSWMHDQGWRDDDHAPQER